MILSNVLTKINPFYFYTMIFIVGIFLVIRFAIASGFNNSTLGVGLALGFGLMGFGGWAAMRFYLFESWGLFVDGIKVRSNFSQHLHSFWLGIALAGCIGLLGIFFPNAFSILTEPFQISRLLSTASEGLSTIDQLLATTGMSPLMETFVFALHILFVVGIFKIIGPILKLSEGMQKFFVIIFFIIFSASTFYLFHVGMVGSMSFLIAVFIYRAMTGVFVLGDKFFNLLPFLTAAFGFEFGYHLMLNIWNTVGIISWIMIMLSDPLGILLVGFIVFLAVLEIYNIKAKGESS